MPGHIFRREQFAFLSGGASSLALMINQGWLELFNLPGQPAQVLSGGQPDYLEPLGKGTDYFQSLLPNRTSGAQDGQPLQFAAHIIIQRLIFIIT
jgi:hypothetical protein